MTLTSLVSLAQTSFIRLVLVIWLFPGQIIIVIEEWTAVEKFVKGRVINGVEQV